MEKKERNYYGWDITVSGKKFCDRFKIRCAPNMSYIFQEINENLYAQLAVKFAEKNGLSPEYEHDREIVERWTDNAINEFVEDISTMEVHSHRDFPFSLFTTLEERIDYIMEETKKEMENSTPLHYYQVLQDDKRFGYRTKI